MLDGYGFFSGVTDDGIIEPYFSWSQCDCCNSKLGGNRYDVIGRELTTDEIEEFSVCEDCYITLCS